LLAKKADNLGNRGITKKYARKPTDNAKTLLKINLKLTKIFANNRR